MLLAVIQPFSLI